MKQLLWILLLFFVLHEGACDEVCTAPGRFPNNTRNDCRGYVMCLKGATSITHYDLVCPEHSIYSHIDNQCTNVTSYQCLSNYTCPQEGNFVNHLDEYCDSYVTCIQDLNNVVSARIIKCPENMIFSATESVCVNSSLQKCIHDSSTLYEASVPQFPDVTVNFSVSGATYLNSVSSFILFLSVVLQFKQ